MKLRDLSGIFGFAAFIIVSIGILLPGMMIVGDRSAWVTWAVIIGAIVLGWLAARRVDRAMRAWLGGRAPRKPS